MSFGTAASQKSVWGFSPQSIPGLALWLDAADSTSITGTSSVTAWRDKSGSGYSVVPNSGTIGSATLNGLNVINFGAGVMRVDNFVWSSSFTQLFVGYVATGDIIIDTLASSTYGDYVYTGNGALMNINTYATNTGVLQVTDSVAGSVIPKNTWFIFSIGYGSTGTAAINYTLNGTVRTTTVYGGSGGSATNPALPLYISGATTSFGTGVQFAELIHFNSVLTTAQRQQVEGYLAAKWGLKANLPATHPYSTGSIIPFNRPFYPTDIPGCSLWLDAADRSSMTFSSGSLTNISGWNDKSGLGNNAAGSTSPYPQYNIKTLNGLPVIGLEGSSDQFFVNNNFTVTTFPTITYACVFSGNGSSGTDPIGGVITTDTAGSYGRSLGLSNRIIQIENYNSFTATSSTLSSGQFYTVVLTFNGATETTVSVNGVKSTYAGSTGSFNNTSGLYIGNYHGDGAQYGINMDIAELLIYGTALTDPQRQQVEQYLTWKWGLPVANLPTGHPGKLLPAFGTPFTPKSVTGLQLWLDAMDQSTMTFSSGTSNVATWNDKSGSGFNMTGFVGVGGSTIPSYSATTALSPPGVVLCSRGTTNHNFFASSVWNSSLTVPTATHCLIAVHNPASTTVSPGNSSLFRFQGTGSTAVTSIVFPQYLNNIPGNGRGVYTNNQGTGTINYYNSSLFENSSAGVLNLITANIAATSQFIYKNGTQQSSYTSTINNVTSDNFVIGCQNWTNINGQQYDFYSGTIHEMFVFNTTLTTPQRQQVEGYLAWKWGLQSSLPSTHAYAKFSP